MMRISGSSRIRNLIKEKQKIQVLGKPEASKYIQQAPDCQNMKEPGRQGQGDVRSSIYKQWFRKIVESPGSRQAKLKILQSGGNKERIWILWHLFLCTSHSGKSCS